MVEGLLVDDFNDTLVAKTVGYIDGCIDSIEE